MPQIHSENSTISIKINSFLRIIDTLHTKHTELMQQE